MRKYMLASQFRVPIWVVEGTSRPSSRDDPVRDLMSKLLTEEKNMPEYRGVAMNRLPNILLTGVDVEPTDAPIFVSDIDKAWEYPSMTEPRAVFALRQNSLKKSFVTLPLDATPEQIEEARRDYPYVQRLENTLWLSRIAELDRNVAYEAAYGHWIPGNAKEALAAIFLFGTTWEVFSTAIAALGEVLKSMPVDTAKQ